MHVTGRMSRHWMVAQGSSNASEETTVCELRSGPPCFEMVAEPSDPKGQGPLVRAPRFQVIWTFMASLMLMAAAGGGNGELGALGMAESFVNMPEEPKAEEHHRKSCRKFEAYDLGDGGHQGVGQQGVQQIESAQTWTSTADLWMDVTTWKSTTSSWTNPGNRIDIAWACACRSLNKMVNQAGRWYSCGVGDTWNLVNKKEPNDNDKHGNLNHFLEMNEYDMMDYGKQHLVINELKVFDGAWFLENVDYKLKAFMKWQPCLGSSAKAPRSVVSPKCISWKFPWVYLLSVNEYALF